MDTDSAYMALSAASLEEVIKPDLRHVHDIEKKNWFPRNDTPEHAAYDKRTPCLFKEEHSGDGNIAMCSNEEEPYYILKTNNPYTFYVPDKYDPNHFMPWVHPFTSVISEPTGSGKSMLVRRFAHNIQHMMTPIPDRILWCYGKYHTLYGTVEGVEYQQELPDLDTLDPRDKHLIILDDVMNESDQRVASLFTKKSHHRNIRVM
jgi:hypothetical protein